MHRTVRLAVAAIALCSLGAGSLAVLDPPGAVAAPVDASGAITSAAFGDAVGVNVHLGLPGTSYADFPRVEALLVALGVRHVRTALPRSPTPQFYSEVLALAARGIRTDLILGSAGAPKGSSVGLTPVATELARIDDHSLAPALDAVEGPNEWDSRGGATWAAQVRSYQATLYTDVHADPRLAGIPVIGPSVANIDHAAELGDLSASLDYGNVHAYPRGQQPLSRLSVELAAEQAVSGTKPVMATETGYQTAVHGSGLQPPVSLTTQAVYTSWLYPAFAKAHVVRTYLYELLNGQSDPTLAVEQDNFGIATAAAGTKPAYTAVQNLLALTTGTTSASATATAAGDPIRVSGVTGAPDDLVVHRADGAWVVMLWSVANVPSDLSSTRSLPAGSASVQLRAPGYVATTYRPALQAGPLHTFATGSTVTGTVGPDIAVVVFDHATPPGTSPIPAGSASSVDAFASPFQPAAAPAPSSSSTPLVVGGVLIAVLLVAAAIVVARRRRGGTNRGTAAP